MAVHRRHCPPQIGAVWRSKADLTGSGATAARALKDVGPHGGEGGQWPPGGPRMPAAAYADRLDFEQVPSCELRSIFLARQKDMEPRIDGPHPQGHHSH